MQEYCNGGSLRSVLQGGAFAQPGAARRWLSVSVALRGLAAGMAYTHGKRICHGDLNPSNILIKVRPGAAVAQRRVCARAENGFIWRVPAFRSHWTRPIGWLSSSRTCDLVKQRRSQLGGQMCAHVW